MNESTGKLEWKFQGKAGMASSPSVAGRTVFVGDEDGRLYSINALTGEPQWQFMADASISSTPVIANGTLYITTMGGTLYAIE